MNRRKFIRNSALLSSSMGFIPFWSVGCRGKSLPEGQEWRAADAYKAENLRPGEVVLAEARENIEKFRKGRMLLSITSGSEPLVNQQVKIEMQDHYFDWGCSSLRTRESFSDDVSYHTHMQQFRNLFNATTAKCYWDERWHQPVENQKGVRILDTFLAEMNAGVEYRMRVKGHPLVWTIPKGIPKWMKNYDHPTRVNIWEKHVKDLVIQGGNDIHNWDVVNEMLWEPAMKNIYNRNWPHIDPIDDIADYVAESLKWVKEVNPNPVRIINDYGLIKEFNDLQSVQVQRQRYLQLIKALRERDEIPDAIGVQSHVGKWFEPDEIVIAFDELAQGGLPIHVTEFWARMRDCPMDISNLASEQQDELLKKYLSDFYTVAFGHPAVQHITYWGNPFFDNRGNTTFMYDTLFALIHKNWSTNRTEFTDNHGALSIDAFYGDYSISVGDQKGRQVSFQPSDNNVVKELFI